MYAKQRLLVALCVVAFVAACAPAREAAGAKPTVRVGSTNFFEQVILSELYAQVLEGAGYAVERRFNLGSREIVAPALEKGEIDMYPEYLATYLTFVTNDDKRATTDAADTHHKLQEALKTKNLTVLDYASAVDNNGFAVTRATAQRHNLAKVSDLTRLSGQLVLGGPPECPNRPFCQQGLERTYGVTFKDFKALDALGPITVAALEGNQVDVAVLLTTDPVIQAKDFVLLQDDKKLQLADNVAPVVRTDLLNRAAADFKTLVNGVTGKVTTEELTGLNKQVGLDKRDAKEVAGAWLKAKGLVK